MGGYRIPRGRAMNLAREPRCSSNSPPTNRPALLRPNPALDRTPARGSWPGVLPPSCALCRKPHDAGPSMPPPLARRSQTERGNRPEAAARRSARTTNWKKLTCARAEPRSHAAPRRPSAKHRPRNRSCRGSDQGPHRSQRAGGNQTPSQLPWLRSYCAWHLVRSRSKGCCRPDRRWQSR